MRRARDPRDAEDPGDPSIDTVESEAAVDSDAVVVSDAALEDDQMRHLVAPALAALGTCLLDGESHDAAEAAYHRAADDPSACAPEVAAALAFLRRCDIPRRPARLRIPRSRLVVHRQGQWFRLDGGAPVACDRWKLLQRLVLAFAHARLTTPGQPLTARALLSAGWPSEAILPRAARNRLHVALHRLRRLGLGELLQREAGGWMLAPDVDVELCDDAGP